MAVFVSASDDGGVGNAKDEYFFAGYVAPELDWPWFAHAWQERVLDGPPRLPYFHMVEWRSRAFRKQWGVTERDISQRIDEAIRVIRGAGSLSAFTFIMRKEDFRHFQQILRDARVPILRGADQPDFVCFIVYSRLIIEYIKDRHPEAERIDFVVSKNGKITTHLKHYADSLRRFIRPELAHLVGDLIPVSMDDRLPLQAADLLCWYQQRWFSTNNGHTMAPLDRRRFGRLIKAIGRQGAYHEWTREDWRDMALGFIRRRNAAKKR